MQWNIIWQQKGVKYWSMIQHGWTVETWCLMKEASHETTNYMVPFIWNVQDRCLQGHRTNQWSCREGLGLERDSSGTLGLFLRWYKCSGGGGCGSWLWWWLHNSVNIQRTIKLHPLSEWTVWYVNFISIKLLKNANSMREPRFLTLWWIVWRHCYKTCKVLKSDFFSN